MIISEGTADRTGPRRIIGRRGLLAIVLQLLPLLLGPGCSSSQPPTAVPPTGDSPKESAEERAKNPLISHD